MGNSQRFPNTVPRELTNELLEFCASISKEQPRMVASRPIFRAKQSYCFDNVMRQIRRKGGQLVSGWAIWHFPGAYFEAEHHGVWGRPDGDLVDVSPQINGARSILFLPDPAAPFDPLGFRSNIHRAERGSEIGEEIVRMASRKNEILDSYRAGGTRVAYLNDADQIEISALEQQLAPLLKTVTDRLLRLADNRPGNCRSQA